MFPILFESSHIAVQTLWVFVAIAMLTSSWLVVRRLKRRRANFNLLIQHSTEFVICALVVSRIVYFFTHTTAYFPAFDLRTVWNFFSVWDQGLSFWGAFLGFMLMLSYRIKKEGESFWKWCDSFSVPMIVGLMIGEIGALLGGFSYGCPTNLPWGIIYETFTVKYTTPVHPTQIYAVLLFGLLLLTKHILKNKTKFFETDGNTTIFLATGFSLLSTLLEFTRGDDTLMLLNIRVPLILFSISTIGFGIALYRRNKSFKSQTNESIETFKPDISV